MNRKHALLSASGASKWLNCTPSAKLESNINETNSSYADEGTLAHDLAEVELKLYFAFINPIEYNTLISNIKKSEYYTHALEEYVKDYVEYCIERYNSYRSKPIVAIEETVYLEPYIKHGFGHTDYSLISETVLEIIDYKHGKGVPVQAEGNKQTLIYALGTYLSYYFLADIQTIRITIYQPRINNITHWELSLQELLYWANNELKQKAALAYEGKGELQAGEWCRFCKVKAQCRAFAKLNLDLAKLDFKSLEAFKDDIPELLPAMQFLTDQEISNIIKGAEVFKNWLNSVLDYALKQALNGKQWPELKVVRGRSIRQYTNPEKILKILLDCDIHEENITHKKLIPITEMEKLLGKERMVKLIGEYIVKPEGGPSLVPDIDKRDAYDKTQEAKNDFTNL